MLHKSYTDLEILEQKPTEKTVTNDCIVTFTLYASLPITEEAITYELSRAFPKHRILKVFQVSKHLYQVKMIGKISEHQDLQNILDFQEQGLSVNSLTVKYIRT